ncbi:type I-E CRISPR-associated protein Cas7/Cse4/CasC [Allostella vacuolata]|nr:type I-E CRISPR-associated protein Cas7/Cse4/CasC [Stella vacuolata]
MIPLLQLHLLVAYPPSAPERDAAGRPKTAIFGNHPRRRISSQSLVRAWCASPVFATTLAGHLSRPVLELVPAIGSRLMAEAVPEPAARAAAAAVAAQFALPAGFQADRALLAPAEQRLALALARRIAAGEAVTAAPGELLRHADDAVDIALFGRALPGLAGFDREAAVQVAHAITTHGSPPEVNGSGDGAPGIDGALYYLYLCIDRGRLISNLAGDEALARAALGTLVLTAATVTAPRDATPSMAGPAPAGYILAESGRGPVRTLAGAFLDPVAGCDLMGRSIAALESHRHRLAAAYGETPETAVMDAHLGRGTLDDIVALATR